MCWKERNCWQELSAMNEQIYEGEGLLARAFCHELDHLDGKMYTRLVEGELHHVSYDNEEEEE